METCRCDRCDAQRVGIKRATPLLVVVAVILYVGCTDLSAGMYEMESGIYLAALSGEVRGLGTGEHCYVTERGYVAAVEEALLDEAIFWAGVGSEKEFEAFILSSPLVFPLKGGIRVYLEAFSYCGKVKIRPAGSTVSVWTVREAIRTEIYE